MYECKRIIIIILLFPFPPPVCHGWRRPVNHNRATPVLRSRCLLPGVQPATCSSHTTGALLVVCQWHIQKQKQRGFDCCYKVHLAELVRWLLEPAASWKGGVCLGSGGVGWGGWGAPLTNHSQKLAFSCRYVWRGILPSLAGKRHTIFFLGSLYANGSRACFS